MRKRVIAALAGSLVMIGEGPAATLPAGRSPLPSPQPASVQHKRVELYGHIVAGVMLNNGVGGQLPGSAFYQLDSVPVTCNHAAGCTIQTVAMVQVYGSAQDGNRWAICTEIDGNYLHQPDCPYLGTIPTDNSGDTRYTTQYASVGTGTHTVTINIYSDSSAIVGGWQTTYNVLIP